MHNFTLAVSLKQYIQLTKKSILIVILHAIMLNSIIKN
jgi:hypothetical protein